MNAKLLENLMLIEGLPSPDRLRLYAQQGRMSLVNVAGVSLRDMYPPQTLAAFDLQEFAFSDFFSQRSMLDRYKESDPREFLGAFAVSQQDHFRRAVGSLREHLRGYRSSAVFCHHGVGRSPAVALAAIHTTWAIPVPQAMALVRAVRPQAHFSTLSASAAAWLAARET